MAFGFSSRSKHHLRTVHPDLQRVLRRALGYGVIDFAVVDGHRGRERQDEYHRTGRSKVRWPDGKHNEFPSKAADLMPWVEGIDMYEAGNEGYWYVLAGLVMAAAAAEGINLRGGYDWDRDSNMHDQSFNDLGHFELC